VSHVLGHVLTDAAHGRFPEPDGGVEVVVPWKPGVAGVVALTGRAYVATTRDARDVLEQRPDGYGKALDPGFIAWLAGADGWCDCLDLLVAGLGTGRGGPPAREDLSDHRRLRHARQLRDDVVVHGDDRGMITFGAGIGGLKEIGVEVPVRARNRGVGRALVADALGLVPAGEPVLGAVAPGNAASLRAFLAAGFQPVGAAHLVRPGGGD
jgi:GNAT superfamily N-acetyltransferase